MNRYDARRWLTYILLTCVSGAILSIALTASFESVSLSSRALIVSMFCLVAGLQLLPAHATTDTRFVELALLPAAGITLSAYFVQLIGGSVLDAGQHLRLFGALFVLATTIIVIQRRLEKVMNSHRCAIATTQVMLAVFSVAPVWLGPVAALNSHRQFIVDAIVAASPVSYLASSVGVDYLRGDWFYQYVEIGLQRFNYPDPATSTLALLAIAFVTWVPVIFSSVLNSFQQRFHFIGVHNNHE